MKMTKRLLIRPPWCLLSVLVMEIRALQRVKLSLASKSIRMSRQGHTAWGIDNTKLFVVLLLLWFEAISSSSVLGVFLRPMTVAREVTTYHRIERMEYATPPFTDIVPF